MEPRISWIFLGLTIVVSQNVICNKVYHPLQRELTTGPGKKTVIGNIDLKKLSAKVKPEDCVDKKKSCHEEVGACILNFGYMFDECKLTCRFCSQGGIKKCEDLDRRCKAWSKAGDCLHYAFFMKDNCRRSCELCGAENHFTDKDERCPIWGKKGTCYFDEHKMLNLCPYSCHKYRRRYASAFTTPYPTSPPLTTRAPVVHTTCPTQATIPPSTEQTEEDKENEKEAKEEKKEEEKQRKKEKEEQERERNGIKILSPPPTINSAPIVSPASWPTPAMVSSPAPIPDAQPASVPAPVQQPASLLASATQPAQVHLPSIARGGEDSNVFADDNDSRDKETEEDTTGKVNVENKKRKNKSKLVIVIGETKRHIKKQRKN